MTSKGNRTWVAHMIAQRLTQYAIFSCVLPLKIDIVLSDHPLQLTAKLMDQT